MDWPTAQAPLIFFEGESEEKLIAEFVKWRAKHPGKYTDFTICEHIFKDLKDGLIRAHQAALVWQKDLNIIERIDEAVRNGGEEKKAITKEDWEAELLALIRNEHINSSMKASMIAGLKLVGESNGWIVKAVEKKTQDLTRRHPTIIFAQPHAA